MSAEGINAVNMRMNIPLFTRAIENALGVAPNSFGNYSWIVEPSAQQEDSNVLQETVLTFAPGQPSTLFDDGVNVQFRGQDRIKRELEITVGTLGEDERVKTLLTGPAGTGKTTLAWIIADMIRYRRLETGLPLGRFFEILPSQISTKEELDVFMQQLKPYDVVFIDEIHILKKNVGAEPLYHTLDDTGVPRYPLGNNAGWVDIPKSVSWIGATTEPGELDDTTGGALRRRLSPELRLDAPSTETLVQILNDQDMLVYTDAAEEMAKRSGGLPWQVINLYNTARKAALFENETAITWEIAQETFDIVGVDAHGLFTEDRLVIDALLQSPYKMRGGELRYKMSEVALCSTTGIDKNTYKQIVQPRLMRLGFLTTVGGQSLTEKSLDIFL